MCRIRFYKVSQLLKKKVNIIIFYSHEYLLQQLVFCYSFAKLHSCKNFILIFSNLLQYPFYFTGTSASTTTAVTVTMTYIPIQTSTNNKVMYVPFNSIQSGHAQPLVLYQKNNALKDSTAKPVILSPQVFPGNKSIMVVSKSDSVNKADKSANTYTTVRIQQGVQQSNTMLKSPMVVPTGMKPICNQFGQNQNAQNFFGAYSESSIRSPNLPSSFDGDVKVKNETDLTPYRNLSENPTVTIKTEETQRHTSSNENDQYSRFHEQSRTSSSKSTTALGTKRKLSSSSLATNDPSLVSSSMETNEVLDENKSKKENASSSKVKKRRGRPGIYEFVVPTKIIKRERKQDLICFVSSSCFQYEYG